MLLHQIYLKTKIVGSPMLHTFGVLWLVIEIIHYFFGDWNWVIGLQDNGWLAFLIIGIIVAIVHVKRRRSMCYRIQGTDVDIEVVVKDIFQSKEAMIAGCNTTFDISVKKNMISGDSIQGQFVNKYFETEEELEDEISKYIRALKPFQSRNRTEKSLGNLDEFAFGTTISVDNTSRKAYLVAISRLNSNMTAEVDDNSFLDALPKMWFDIRAKGGMENLDCPILGSGFSRLKLNRQNLMFELIRSFVAATRDGKLTEKITFYVSPRDFRRGHVDLEKVRKFLECQCEGDIVVRAGSAPMGTGI